ncbi:MAG: alpha/beta hydrolase [Actinomycetota bacterium]|nr:alpha/beta hydrolase [Actinomycetota bacterium]
MADRRRRALTAAATAAGVAAGYFGEREAFRGRVQFARHGPELGDFAGDSREFEGPDATTIFVETYGPDGPDVPQVVFVHGYTMSGRCWHEQVVALRHRYQLITYDQPGHARSSPPRSGTFTIELLGDALATVIEQATDHTRGPLVVVGHSMGGMTALACARRHGDLFRARVGGLVLLSTTVKSGAEDVALGLGVQLLARAERAITAGAGLLGDRVRELARIYRASTDLSYVLVRGVALSRGADPRYVDFTEQLVLDTDLRTASQLLPVLARMDEEHTLATLDVPTLVVVGARDRMTPVDHARHMAEVNPDVDVVELPGIGHMTPLEAHHAVNALVVHMVGAVHSAAPSAEVATS